MEPLTTLGTTALKPAAQAFASRFGASLGGPFRTELATIREAIEGLRTVIELERVSLLHDGFEFLAQDDLDNARASLTRAKTREPRNCRGRPHPAGMRERRGVR
jgi:hypothetical protein